MKPIVDDWADPTRPTGGHERTSNVVRQALARLRATIEPAPRITEPMIEVPAHLFDQVCEVRPSQPVIA